MPKALIIRDCPEASLPKMFPWGLAFSEAHSCTRPPPALRPELGLTKGQADNLDTVTSQCPDLGGKERRVLPLRWSSRRGWAAGVLLQPGCRETAEQTQTRHPADANSWAECPPLLSPQRALCPPGWAGVTAF